MGGCLFAIALVMNLKRRLILNGHKVVNSRVWPTGWLLIKICLPIIVLLVLWRLIQPWLYSQAWIGFGASQIPRDQNEKKLWDWMELLIIPLVLGFGLYWFNREEQISKQKIELDRLQENSLQDYFDKMTELTLEKGLHQKGDKEAATYEIARRIARARTLAVLPGLNGTRKGVIIRFLLESGLIVGSEPIIDLFWADLSQVQLQGCNLENICLKGTILANANLKIASINGANFKKANLKGANFTLAHVLPVNPIPIEQRSGDQISYEWLSYYMREGYLKGDFQVDLRFADLSNATLEGATLFGVNLEHAKLHGAKLWRARLDGANLTSADITEKQLGEVYSLYAAILPDGSRYDGRFTLVGDIEKAIRQGINPKNYKLMEEWYAGRIS